MPSATTCLGFGKIFSALYGHGLVCQECGIMNADSLLCAPVTKTKREFCFFVLLGYGANRRIQAATNTRFRLRYTAAQK